MLRVHVRAPPQVGAPGTAVMEEVHVVMFGDLNGAVTGTAQPSGLRLRLFVAADLPFTRVGV